MFYRKYFVHAVYTNEDGVTVASGTGQYRSWLPQSDEALRQMKIGIAENMGCGPEKLDIISFNRV